MTEILPTQTVSDGILLFLPLCPSTNARMRPVRMGRYARSILTREARDYIQTVGLQLKLWANTKKFKPIRTPTHIDLWFILPRTNCDAHNYQKILFDALETGGIVANDKFILPRIMGVGYESKGEIIVKLPIQKRTEKNGTNVPREQNDCLQTSHE